MYVEYIWGPTKLPSLLEMFFRTDYINSSTRNRIKVTNFSKYRLA